MEISLETLVEIINSVRSMNDSENKAYTDAKTIISLASAGGRVITNRTQCDGSWLTQVGVGLVIFVHASEKQIVQ